MIIRLLRYLFIAIFLFAAAAAGAFLFLANNSCIDFSALEQYNPGKPSILLDDQGNEWARFQLDRREPIKIEVMPKHLINAFIAAEDWSFFTHAGISWKGIIRSMVVNLYHGRRMQGASTITQQLVRLLFFDAKKTFSRKIKEQVVALLVERQFTKQQILETYLNHVCFGCGIYGVEAASERFWGKHAADITVDQAAILASIVRCPAHYCPLLALDSTKSRRDVILHSMRKLNFIDQPTYEQVKTQPIVIKETDAALCAPHLKETLRIVLENIVDKELLYTGGLTIQTTLNVETQQVAEQTFREQILRLKNEINPHIDGAVICIEVKTGEVKALVGGYDFGVSKFNRALQARRQLGSVFKPIVYAAALEAGMSFADTDVDEPFTIETPQSCWQPHNYDDQFEGRMTLARALSRSGNIIAIKTLLAIGAENVVALAQRCKLPGPLGPYPSLALGCVDVTLKEAAATFNVFANQGVYVAPFMIKWVKDEWGRKIWKVTTNSERVLGSRVAGQVTRVLSFGLERARKRSSQPWYDCQAIGKTGTTNDSRTCWFAGSTPSMTTLVYVGCDDNKSMGKDVYPIRTAFPIWLAINRAVESPIKKFSLDSSLREQLIDEFTGQPLFDAQKAHAVSILV